MEYLRESRAREATGASLGDRSRWLARKVEAFVILQTEENRQQEAEMKARSKR
jgi:hypothetical protein